MEFNISSGDHKLQMRLIRTCPYSNESGGAVSGSPPRTHRLHHRFETGSEWNIRTTARHEDL